MEEKELYQKVTIRKTVTYIVDEDGNEVEADLYQPKKETEKKEDET